MRVLRKLKLANSVSAAIIATGVCLAGFVAVPAVAQVVLGADQIAAIQASLRTALLAAKGDAAVEAAIANAEQSAITLYGPTSASSVTSIVLSAAENASVGQCTIGRGLGAAAASLAPTNVTGASGVATTVANEGGTLERSCFQTATTSLGYANLASIAGGEPTATGGTGGVGLGGLGGGFTGGGVAGGGGGGCLNPSCTRI